MKVEISRDVQLTGIILFGDSEFDVGLTNSQHLKIPIDRFPQLSHASEDERTNYKLHSGNSVVRWPSLSLHLTVEQLAAAAASVDDGSISPK